VKNEVQKHKLQITIRSTDYITPVKENNR